MYSESDIDGAVAAGALSPEQARQFRAHVSALRAGPLVDEESFRLLTGFNDIFVSIAIALLLAAVAQIGAWVAGGDAQAAGGGVAVAGTAWLLAEYFTGKRRMALPSILLLLAFVGGAAATAVGTVMALGDDNLSETAEGLVMAGVALVAAGAAWIHWRRFHVPITVAAGVVAAAGVAGGLFLAAVPSAQDAIWPLVLVAGLGVFALAMRWDLSDRERRTRRADVAFWLHLAAAPMIAHSIFQMLGVNDGQVGAGVAAAVLGLYVLFAIVALAVDRRALLVSGLVYVLSALFSLFRSAGAVELNWALTAFVIGSALLTLSAFWHPMRRAVVARLGGWGERLPPVAMAAQAA